MSANLRIIPKNDHDDATLTVSVTTQTGFDATNTQNTVRTSTLRSANISASMVVTGVLSASRVASAFVIPRHTLLGASVRLQLFSDAGASVSVYDSTALPVACYTASEPYVWSEGSNDPFAASAPYWLYFTEKTYRSYKITFSGTPSAVSYYEAGRIWIGRYLEVSVNAAFGLELGWQSIEDRVRTQGGSLRGNMSALIRTLLCDLNAIPDTEYATWMDIMQQVGTTGEVVVSVFPGDGTRKEALHTIAGTFSSLNSINRQVKVLTKRLQLEES